MLMEKPLNTAFFRGRQMLGEYPRFWILAIVVFIDRLGGSPSHALFHRLRRKVGPALRASVAA